MKAVKLVLGVVSLGVAIASLEVAALASPVQLASEGQEGKGGDPVEPLFIKAKQDAISILDSFVDADLAKMPFEENVKNWLKRENLGSFKYVLHEMELVFQETSCTEPEGPRPTCFDHSDYWSPKMIVSRPLNRSTTPEQAIALVFHEAGHLIGEKDHVLLSQVGVELARLKGWTPQWFVREASASVGVHRDVLGMLYSKGDDRSAILKKMEKHSTSMACRKAVTEAQRSALQACRDRGNAECRVSDMEELQKKMGREFIWLRPRIDFVGQCRVKVTAVNF